MATQSITLLARRRRWRQRDVIPYVFILPNLVLFAVFVLGPVRYSFGMSFTNWDGLGRPTFTELRNYADAVDDQAGLRSEDEVRTSAHEEDEYKRLHASLRGVGGHVDAAAGDGTRDVAAPSSGPNRPAAMRDPMHL